MPYKSCKIKIAGTSYDRRIKLTAEDKERIKELYQTGEYSQRRLAREFSVSRRLISFILHPELEEKAREAFKKRRSDGRYKLSSEDHAALIREHRRYKQDLYLKGKISEGCD